MDFVRIYPMRRIGENHLHDSDMRLVDVAVVMHGKSAFAMRPVGCLVRDRLLWKNALLSLSTPQGLVQARGMAEAIAAIRRFAPTAEMRVALPIHDGYLAVYGEDGIVQARILSHGKTGSVRIMNPHASFVVKGNVDTMISAAYAKIAEGGQ